MEWGFPSVGSFINNNSFAIVLCILALFASTVTIVAWSSATHESDASDDNRLKYLVGGVAFFLATGIGLLGLGYGYNKSSECRNFNLTSVSHITVASVPNEFAYPEKMIRHERSEALISGLIRLRHAGDRGRRKSEFFEGGYRFELFTSDSRTPRAILYYFTRTNKGDPTDAVVVQCRPSTGQNYEISNEVFSAPTFGEWVRREIIPNLAVN